MPDLDNLEACFASLTITKRKASKASINTRQLRTTEEASSIIIELLAPTGASTVFPKSTHDLGVKFTTSGDSATSHMSSSMMEIRRSNPPASTTPAEKQNIFLSFELTCIIASLLDVCDLAQFRRVNSTCQNAVMETSALRGRLCLYPAASFLSKPEGKTEHHQVQAKLQYSPFFRGMITQAFIPDQTQVGYPHPNGYVLFSFEPFAPWALAPRNWTSMGRMLLTNPAVKTMEMVFGTLGHGCKVTVDTPPILKTISNFNGVTIADVVRVWMTTIRDHKCDSEGYLPLALTPYSWRGSSRFWRYGLEAVRDTHLAIGQSFSAAETWAGMERPRRPYMSSWALDEQILRKWYERTYSGLAKWGYASAAAHKTFLAQCLKELSNFEAFKKEEGYQTADDAWISTVLTKRLGLPPLERPTESSAVRVFKDPRLCSMIASVTETGSLPQFVQINRFCQKQLWTNNTRHRMFLHPLFGKPQILSGKVFGEASKLEELIPPELNPYFTKVATTEYLSTETNNILQNYAKVQPNSGYHVFNFGPSAIFQTVNKHSSVHNMLLTRPAISTVELRVYTEVDKHLQAGSLNSSPCNFGSQVYQVHNATGVTVGDVFKMWAMKLRTGHTCALAFPVHVSLLPQSKEIQDCLVELLLSEEHAFLSQTFTELEMLQGSPLLTDMLLKQDLAKCSESAKKLRWYFKATLCKKPPNV